MQEIKDALLRMVNAGLKVKKMQQAYADAGLDDNVLFDAYGDICSAIYSLIGEHTEEFNDSVTDIAMNTASFVSVERRVKMLMFEYRKNHPEQPVVDMPKPNLISPESMRKMMERNGGYMTPEGDWS